jgi:D-3-phosphoglycerate dehydrogenase / 2-oxoglutarate reductase
MRVVLCSPVHASAIHELERRHDVVRAWDVARPELLDLVAGAAVLVARSGVMIDDELIRRAAGLRLVIRAGSGTDNIALETLASRGIALERVPEPGADAVAEMTIALLLAVLRHIPEADRSVRAGQWRKHELTGHRAAGRVLGIVGAGTIGRRVGLLANALGMSVLGCVAGPRTSAHRAGLARRGIQLLPFDDVIERADVVSVHTPLTSATRGLIDREALMRMRPGSYLLSLARGGVVDEAALREALVAGHLAGAALDVHEVEGDGLASPLADLPNVVLTPHIGAGTHEAQEAIGARIVDLVARLTTSDQPAPATAAALSRFPFAVVREASS